MRNSTPPVANATDTAKQNSRKYETPIFWQVISKARKIYDVQIDQNVAIKQKAIMRFVPASYANPKNFWIEFEKQKNRLLDSRRFISACEAAGLDDKNVAENIVFMGSSTLNKVLKFGIDSVLGASIELYGEQISPMDEKKEQ